MSERKLRFGAAGLGRAFTLMAPTFAAHPRATLSAAADPRPEARAQCARDFGARTYASVDELCADPEIDAVYIATPHQFHAAHAIAAARCGKHVLVEKPMALTLDECFAMIEAAQRSKVHIVVGHSHSFDAPIRRTREIIAGGSVGALRMIAAMNYTDFLYRPRRAEELNTAMGGGVVYNQAPHHVDIVRLLAGGRVDCVRALTGAWDEGRPTEGAYSALLSLAGGAFASIAYSGYAHFDSDELMEWIAESGLPKDSNAYGTARALLNAKPPDSEIAFKAARNYGGKEGPRLDRPQQKQRFHQQFGLLIASCERADLRPTARGVAIYGDSDRRFETSPGPEIPRSEVVDEICDAVFHAKPPLHSGAWGLATMEVCLAILQSARERRDIALKYQTGIPPSEAQT